MHLTCPELFGHIFKQIPKNDIFFPFQILCQRPPDEECCASHKIEAMRTQQQLGSFFEQLHPMFVPPATSIQVSKSLTLPNKIF